MKQVEMESVSRCELRLLERMVLESLVYRPCGMTQLVDTLQLDSNILKYIVDCLVARGIISKVENNFYELNYKKFDYWSQIINAQSNVKRETMELVLTWVKAYFQKQPHTYLRLQKAWFTTDEEMAWRGIMNQMDEFLRKILKEQKERESSERSIYHKKILLWGVSEYGDLVESYLNG